MGEHSKSYIDKCRDILDVIQTQHSNINKAADWFAESIAAERLVHLFGGGHSRIMVEEMWPRYGSFPGFHPIVELSLTFHNAVVGANGQRQAMFLENQSGLAARILRNFELNKQDSALVVSSSGTNIVPIEIAECFQKKGIKVVVLCSLAHSKSSKSKRSDGKKLTDFADLVLDTGAPTGDAMVEIDKLEGKVSPGSTVGGCVIVNSIKAEVAARLVAMGKPPRVLAAANLVGVEKSGEMFEAAYDDHARRICKLFENIGQ